MTTLSSLLSAPLAAVFNLGSLELSAGVLIPLTAIIMPFLFVIVVACVKFFHDRRTQELQHETIRLALEKGQPIPPDLFVVKSPIEKAEKSDKKNDRKAGLILIAVGVGLLVLLGGASDLVYMHSFGGLRWVGLIPALIGVAFLVNCALEKRDETRNKN